MSPAAPALSARAGYAGLKSSGTLRGLVLENLARAEPAENFRTGHFTALGSQRPPPSQDWPADVLGGVERPVRQDPAKCRPAPGLLAPEPPALRAPAAPGSWWQVGDGRMHPPPGQRTCAPPGSSAVGRAKLMHRSPEEPNPAQTTLQGRGGWAALGRAPWCPSCLPSREFSLPHSELKPEAQRGQETRDGHTASRGTQGAQPPHPRLGSLLTMPAAMTLAGG